MKKILRIAPAQKDPGLIAYARAHPVVRSQRQRLRQVMPSSSKDVSRAPPNAKGQCFDSDAPGCGRGGLGYGGGFGRVLMPRSPALGLVVPEKYPVQHECADKREHAHANAKAVGLKKIVVDQHSGEQRDRQRQQESDDPLD